MDGRPGSVSDLSLQLRRYRRSGETALELPSQRLERLPDELFRLDKITKLDLSHNLLQELDVRIGQMSSLTELNLSRNRLKELPAQALLQLPLQALLVSGNPLEAPYDQLLPEKRAPALRQALEGLAPFKSPVQDVLDRGSGHAMDTVDNSLRATSDASWRKERQALLTELEQLRAKVDGRGGGGASWLSSGQLDLPSQRAAHEQSKAAEQVSAELRTEQQQNQRLQREVQKLEVRLKEVGGMDSASSVPTFSLDAVQIGDVIAQGGFAQVCVATWLHTRVACKRITDPVINDALLADFDNEVTMLSRLRHPRILQIMAVCRTPPKLAVITELIECGTLYDLLFRRSRSQPELTREQSRSIALQVAEGVNYLHHMAVVHRDLKSQNVLLSASLDAKLCDFGLARMRSDLCTGRMQYAGTPSYMAPELFRKETYTDKVDVFAFGAMLIEIFQREVPFDGLDGGEIAQKWDEGYQPRLSSALPRELRQLILRCYDGIASARPNMAQVVPELAAVPVD